MSKAARRRRYRARRCRQCKSRENLSRYLAQSKDWTFFSDGYMCDPCRRAPLKDYISRLRERIEKDADAAIASMIRKDSLCPHFPFVPTSLTMPE